MLRVGFASGLGGSSSVRLLTRLRTGSANGEGFADALFTIDLIRLATGFGVGSSTAESLNAVLPSSKTGSSRLGGNRELVTASGVSLKSTLGGSKLTVTANGGNQTVTLGQIDG